MLQQGSAFAVGGSPVNRQWHDTGKGIAMLLALTLMVCGMRLKVGFQHLRYGSLFLMTFVMLALTWLVNFPLVTWILGNGIARGDISLRFFALVFLGVGLWQRRARKQEKWDQDRPHGYSHGTSWFADFLPLREDYVYRFVDPLVALLVGTLLRYRLGLPLLGLWWMVGACAFFIAETNLYRQAEKHDWDMGDGLIAGTRDAEVLRRGRAEAQRGSRADYGIPTGRDAGLAAEIEKRRQERAGNPPEEDGLAGVTK